MAAIIITNDTFEQEVLQSEKTVLVDFWAKWCGPCKIIHPILDEIDEEREDVKICLVNVDEEPDLAERFRIMTIPTLMVFRDGELKTSSQGAKPKSSILNMLQEETWE